MKRPLTPELRRYLLDLVREERLLERVYRASHSPEDLRAVCTEWKSAYHQVRGALVVEDVRIGLTRAQTRCAGRLEILPVTQE